MALSDHLFPQSGDTNYAVDFSQLAGQSNSVNYVETGLSFTPDYTVPEVSVSEGVTYISTGSESTPADGSADANEQREATGFAVQVASRTVSLTDGDVNYIYVEPTIGVDDSITVGAVTSTSNIPTDALRIGTVDTGADTYTEENRDPDATFEQLTVTGGANLPDDVSFTFGANDDYSVEYDSGRDSLLFSDSSGAGLLELTDTTVNVLTDLSVGGNVDLSGGDLSDGSTTIWDTSAQYIPQGRLENSSLTVAGGDGISAGSVSLGGSVTVAAVVTDFAGAFLAGSGTNDLDVQVGSGLEGDGTGAIRTNGGAIAGSFLSEGANAFDVDVNLGFGLAGDGSNNIAVQPGAGLEADGSGSPRVAGSAVADGFLSEGGSAHQLSVNLGGGLEGDGANNIRVQADAVAGTYLAEDGTNAYQVNVQIGAGLEGDGTGSIRASGGAIAGNGLVEGANPEQVAVATDGIGTSELDTTVGYSFSATQDISLADAADFLTLTNTTTGDVLRASVSSGNVFQLNVFDSSAGTSGTERTGVLAVDPASGTALLQQGAQFGGAVDLAGNDLSDGATTIWDTSAGFIPQSNLENSSLSVNSGSGLSGGGSVSLGGSISLSHADTSTQSNVSAGAGDAITDLTFDTYGHVTSASTTDFDSRFLNAAGDDLGSNSLTSVGELQFSDVESLTATEGTLGYDDSEGLLLHDGEGHRLIADGENLQGGTDITVSGGQGSASSPITIAHADTSSQGNVSAPTGGAIRSINLDGNGHVTSASTVDFDGRFVLEAGDTMSGQLTVNDRVQTDGPVTESVNIPTQRLDAGEFSALTRIVVPTGKSLRIKRVTVTNDGFSAPTGLNVVVRNATSATNVKTYNTTFTEGEPLDELAVGGDNVIIAVDNGDFTTGTGSTQYVNATVEYDLV